MLDVCTVEGDLVSRVEIFDEADLDAALARFEALQRQPRHLENAASRVLDRYMEYFRARNWAALAEILTDDSVIDDRHDVVNVGLWDGRDVVIANLQALAEAAPTSLTVIATRGERLVLSRMHSPNRDLQYGDFSSDMLVLAEIDTDERIAAQIAFDVDDVDAAFGELDARYLAGEAAANEHTWSLMGQCYAVLNRHEMPPTTPGFVNVDHRRGRAFEPGNLVDYAGATWDVVPDVRMHAETVHRLTNIGSLVTQTAYGTSHEGFEAEWRQIVLVTFEGDRANRCELFDEADVDAALARFDELDRPARRLENEATRARERLADAINLRDVDRLLALTTADAQYEDRRKGLRDEGVARPEVVRAIFEVAPRGWRLDVAPIAIRGTRLALTRDTMRDTEDAELPITAEHLTVTEVIADGLMRNSVLFDPDDIEAAFAELDARYIAGEGAAYANTWSVVARTHAAVNRRELPAMTPDHVYVDHRPLVSLEGVDVATSLGAMWDITSDFNVYAEAVHRLDELGVVVTQVLNATTHEGLDAELRMIAVAIVERELCSRIEYFDEADLDAALARFEELHPQAPRLKTRQVK
jgi:hypothetical protein